MGFGVEEVDSCIDPSWGFETTTLLHLTEKYKEVGQAEEMFEV